MDEHRPAKHSVPSLYKTRLCRTFMERGNCPYGEKCDFAHGTKDLSYDITKHPKYRTKLCRSFQDTGNCIYGDRCCFSHSLARTGILGLNINSTADERHNTDDANNEDTIQNKTSNETNDETPTKNDNQENNQNKVSWHCFAKQISKIKFL